jgi:hypothetical protein
MILGCKKVQYGMIVVPLPVPKSKYLPRCSQEHLRIRYWIPLYNTFLIKVRELKILSLPLHPMLYHYGERKVLSWFLYIGKRLYGTVAQCLGTGISFYFLASRTIYGSNLQNTTFLL